MGLSFVNRQACNLDFETARVASDEVISRSDATKDAG